jgi:hypothetical protein
MYCGNAVVRASRSPDRQHLPGDMSVEGIHESPERALHRQFGDFQDARQNRVASDEAQLVQPREADVEPQHDCQHEPVQVHGARDTLRGQCLFQQGLKAQFLQHGDHRQQSAVGGRFLPAKS